MAVEIKKEFLDELTEVIQNRDSARAAEMIQDMHPADIAEYFEEIDLDDCTFLFMLLDAETKADVLVELEDDEREKLLETIPSDVIGEQLIDKMESDDAADILGDLDDDVQEEILSHVKDVDQAGDIVDLLSYDEDTAGGIMAKELVSINENLTVEQAHGEMRDQADWIDEGYGL